MRLSQIACINEVLRDRLLQIGHGIHVSHAAHQAKRIREDVTIAELINLHIIGVLVVRINLLPRSATKGSQGSREHTCTIRSQGTVNLKRTRVDRVDDEVYYLCNPLAELNARRVEIDVVIVRCRTVLRTYIEHTILGDNILIIRRNSLCIGLTSASVLVHLTRLVRRQTDVVLDACSRSQRIYPEQTFMLGVVLRTIRVIRVIGAEQTGCSRHLTEIGDFMLVYRVG